MPATNVATTFASMQWVILPEKLAEIAAIVERFEQGVKLSAEEARASIGNSIHTVDAARHGASESEGNGAVARISVLGTMMNRASAMNMISGATTYNQVAARVRSAAGDPEISKIVLDLDTPGGTVVGVDILAQAVREAKNAKPVIAVVNDMAASAGYWVASQATEIVASRSSVVGSISVIATHQDMSNLEEKLGVKTTILTTGAYKGLGHPSQGLSDAHKAKIEERIGRTHATFVSTIADGRGLSMKDANRLATGETWDGEEAIENGLVDKIATLEDILEGSYSPTAKATVHAVQTPDAMTPEQQAELDALKSTVTGLQETISTLAGGVTTLVEAQKAQIEQDKTIRAQNLINPLVQSGAVTPAKAQDLITQATENYDLVAATISAMGVTPNGAVPLANQIGAPVDTTGRANNSVQTEVFDQLGLLGFDGKVNLQNVTLGLDSNGAMASMSANEVYKADRVVPQVAHALGSWLA